MKFNALTIIVMDLFYCLIVIFMAQAAPPPQPMTRQQIEEYGDLKIDIVWRGPSCVIHDDDVDLWTLAPGGGAVGYSHKTDHGMALLRDDLGPGGDADSKCEEYSIAAIARPGEYVANVHLYRARAAGKPPVPVTLVVSLKGDDGQWHNILTITKNLEYEGQELTLARFRLDDKKHLIPGSVNDLPFPLRSAR